MKEKPDGYERSSGRKAGSYLKIRTIPQQKWEHIEVIGPYPSPGDAVNHAFLKNPDTAFEFLIENSAGQILIKGRALGRKEE